MLGATLFCSTLAALPLLALAAACGRAAPAPAPPRAPPDLEPEVTVEAPKRQAAGALTPAERDSILRQLTARRDAWRARHISDYKIQIAVGCFCPWPSHPAILEVRGGAVVALWDTTGKSLGAPREPWDLYTVEGLFAAVETGASRNDVIEIAYDPRYDYPAMISGVHKKGLPDNWFWVKASRLTPSR